MMRFGLSVGVAWTLVACGRLEFSSQGTGDGGATPEANVATEGNLRVTAGGSFSCVVGFLNSQTVCFGADSFGQLGESVDGDNFDEPLPVPVDTTSLAPNEGFENISAGENHACGLSVLGNVYCWGHGANGRLGFGGGNSDIPRPINTEGLATGERFVSVDAGDNGTCAVTNRFRVFCWGADAAGENGNDANLQDSTTPVLVDRGPRTDGEGFLQVSRGGHHACAVSNRGNVYCWGSNVFGQLGNGGGLAEGTVEPVPVRVDAASLGEGGRFVSVSAGAISSCAIADDGEAYCWGSNATGSLGRRGPDSNTPSRVTKGFAFRGDGYRSISVGTAHACGTTTLGDAFCWGDDSWGQLGDGPEVMSLELNQPVDRSAVEGPFQSISVGSDHTCATTVGGVYCWGDDRRGQLGEHADVDNLPEPSPVTLLQSA